MAVDPVAAANDALREKGYAERDLAVHPGPRGKALLKGNKIISPFSDEATVPGEHEPPSETSPPGGAAPQVV